MPRPAPEDWSNARVVVVVAHPDDEVLGCGALLARLRDVTVIHVTDGAPREGADAARHGFATAADYAAARRTEALAALAIAGVAPDRLHGLAVADQTAPAELAAITRALRPLIDGASVMLTHAYEGGHGDHDAVAFAAHAAWWLMEETRRPALVEMPFYHADATGWVRQQFLPVQAKSVCSPSGADEAAPAVCNLSPGQRNMKARMMAAHSTQTATLCDFPLDTERFRFAPSYDFMRRPHDGPLLYERHGWALTWPLWTAHVEAARAALDLAAP